MPRLFQICMFLLALLLQQSIRLAEWTEPPAAATLSDSARDGDVNPPEDGTGERVVEDAASGFGAEPRVGGAAACAVGSGWAAGLSRGRRASGALFKPPRA